MLDSMVAAAVEEPPRDAPPASPVAGSCFIVGAAPTGAWATHASKLAAYSAGGWRFLDPPDGLHVWVKSLNVRAVRRGGAWHIGEVRCSRLIVSGAQVVGPQLSAVAAPTGGSIADVEARAAIAAILAALREHGLIAA